MCITINNEEGSSARVSSLHKQILFILFLVCFRSNHLLIATSYRPILKAYIRRS